MTKTFCDRCGCEIEDVKTIKYATLCDEPGLRYRCEHIKEEHSFWMLELCQKCSIELFYWMKHKIKE